MNEEVNSQVEEAKIETANVVVEESTKTPAELAGEDKKEIETVPLATLLEFKKENKEVKRELAELKKSIENGATKSEISKSIQQLAEDNNVDVNFLQDFANSIKKASDESIEEKIANRLKPIEEKEKAEKISKAFDSVYEKIIEENPEYKGVASKEVIKALSLNPENKNKTFNKIIEDAYGHLIKGKKSIDSTSPGKKNSQSLNVSKLADPEYFEEVMDNPKLKEEYNKGLLERLS